MNGKGVYLIDSFAAIFAPRLNWRRYAAIFAPRLNWRRYAAIFVFCCRTSLSFILTTALYHIKTSLSIVFFKIFVEFCKILNHSVLPTVNCQLSIE